MFRMLTGAAVLVLVVLSGASADDKKADDKDKPALSGTWTRESGGLDMKYEFVSKDMLKISVFGGENGAIVTAKYTVDKDGVVKIKVTEVEEKGNFPGKPPKGVEFSFKWKVKGDTATLDDFMGIGDDAKKIAEAAAPLIEGEYVRKKDKK
jgi:hypothetical protein